MHEFRMPDPGEGLTEAEIVRWLVAEGDEVAVNDTIVEIETAKSLVELPAPVAGRVARLLVAEGDLVAVGSPIIRIDDGQDVIEATLVETPETPEEAVGPSAVEGDQGSGNMLVGYGTREGGSITRRPRKGVPAVPAAQSEQVSESYDTDKPVSRPIDQTTTTGLVSAVGSGAPLPEPGHPETPPEPPREVLAKPSVRQRARELGVELNDVVGTGRGGVVTAQDVEAAARDQGLSDRREPLRGIRREMFRSMTQSLKVPQATAWVTIDVTATMELVESLRGRREFQGLRISPLLIFAKAACLAIARNPYLNSSLDQEREEIIVRSSVNLGIAAATPRGLVVPNIKRADRMSLLELAKALNEMVDIARTGRVQPSDTAKGTFTITNIGIFGIDAGTPIVNPGEAAIMCLGTAARRPWIVGEGESERIEPRWVCTVAITFDHRLVDGEMASRFLADVGTIMSEPGLSLLF